MAYQLLVIAQRRSYHYLKFNPETNFDNVRSKLKIRIATRNWFRIETVQQQRRKEVVTHQNQPSLKLHALIIYQQQYSSILIPDQHTINKITMLQPFPQVRQKPIAASCPCAENFPITLQLLYKNFVMSLTSQPKSRGSTRNQYIASSIRKNENISSLNYNNHYGTPSLSKDIKPITSPPYLSYLSSANKVSGLLPKIDQSCDRREEERGKNGYIRESGYKRQQTPSSCTLSTSQVRRLGDSQKGQLKSKEYEPIGYLRQMQQQKQTVFRHSKQQSEQPLKPKTLGLVGLNNIGNTCFMNSTLQCMLNLPKFNDYFLLNSHHREMNSSCKVAVSYGRLVQLVKSSSSRAETPSELKSAVAANKPRFSGYGQQDAQQFLLGLLELLSSELNRSKNPKYKELKADLSKNTLQESEQWWNYNKQRQNSVVCDYFAGQVLSKVVCSKCSSESIAFDNTWDFALNFTYNDNGEILKMIENFLKEETIAEDYYCSKCKAFKECKRKLYLYRLPQIIVLQIKRFSYGKFSKQKLNNRVKVPSTLNLSKVITYNHHVSVKDPVYELVGVVNHMGEINYGHYTADCRNSLNGRWYCFNDSSVNEIAMAEQLDSSSPYLLFYSKK